MPRTRRTNPEVPLITTAAGPTTPRRIEYDSTGGRHIIDATRGARSVGGGYDSESSSPAARASSSQGRQRAARPAEGPVYRSGMSPERARRLRRTQRALTVVSLLVVGVPTANIVNDQVKAHHQGQGIGTLIDNTANEQVSPIDTRHPFREYIAQPGDTLTEIAKQAEPGTDPRNIVAQIARTIRIANGGAVEDPAAELQPGFPVPLPDDAQIGFEVDPNDPAGVNLRWPVE